MKTTRRLPACLVGFALAGLTLARAQDRVTIPLTDPGQPVTLRASVLNGGITVKGSSGKDVVAAATMAPVG